ncbi:hypothetical protein QBC40DRAFT_109396 [Triangularia verruculosa]|uniref:Uncharacterized protein n=1 Tax=Triangularia verruculosa TaxID=2587418 RepID=A0AAN6XA66_9PEZI|nr:hypothetical protein QBC40DRAFT_109396 [Triangularia verruculosa]
MATIYQDMYTDDDLAELLARQLHFESVPRPQPVPAPVEVVAPQPVQAPKIVYVSQHYNHSAAHLAKQKEQQQQQQQQQSPARPSSEPPQDEHSAIARVLRQHSVDPTNLSPAQFHLFKTVDDPQRMHLIELWRACPPPPHHPSEVDYNSTTSLDQEEALARMRWEQAQQDEMEAELQAQLEHEYQLQMEEQQRQQRQQQQQEIVMSLDGTPLTPIQAGDGRWIQTTAEYGDMEPYMAAGYQEELARREYEESARRALLFTEPSAYEKDMMMSESLGRFGPALLQQEGAIGTGTGGSGGTGETTTKRATDPVYKSVGVDWAAIRRREEEYQMSMSEGYGRLMLARGMEDDDDEEML